MSTVIVDLSDIVGRSVPGKVVFRPLNTPFPDSNHRLRVSASRTLCTDRDGRGEIELAGGNYEVRVWDRDEEFLDLVTIGVPDDEATYDLSALIDGGVVPPVPPIVQGPPGSQILSDGRDPVAGDGANGDYFFNTATGTLFGPKAHGAWPPTGIPLHGEPGSDGSDGTDGIDGQDGADGREVELQVAAGYIQWRYVGEAWSNLVALSTLKGDPGEDGADGVDGADGSDGSDGRELELQKSATHVQWRYTGSPTWTDLVALADLKGDTGDTGLAATIEVGDVTTGEPGTDVQFENVGTLAAAKFNVKIPRGNTGPLNQFESIALSGADMDCVRDRIFSKTISANTTFTFSDMADGRVVVLILTTSGSAAPSWPAGMAWQGSILPFHAPSSTVWYQFAMADGVITGFAVPVGVPA